MNRRKFMKTSGILLASWPLTGNNLYSEKPVLGHGNKKYTWDNKWLSKNKVLPAVKDCHEMIFTPEKKIILLTNDVRNNFIVFSKDGKVEATFGHDFPGGHGLTYGGVKGDDFLMVTDYERHMVFRVDTSGKIIRTWTYPAETGKYDSESSFLPTETAVSVDGEFYVADGYGAQHIMHYDKDGFLKNIFGGRGDGPQHLDNAHGICIDYRKSTPTLIITDRNRCCFKRFTMDGTYLGTIPLPGANVCRPVIKGDYLYVAVLTTDYTGNTDSGFVIILDKDDKLVSAPGGSVPHYDGDIPAESYQTIRLFKHPHDVLVDDDENMYVCQWNSGNVLPYKLVPHD